MKRKYRPNPLSRDGVRLPSEGERKAMRDGVQARRDGYAGRNPYTTVDGSPIPAFRKLAVAWQRGYDA